MTERPPVSVRRAGLVVAAEGIAGLVVAVALVVAGAGGPDARMAFGTAGWFVLVGGGVLAAGIALWTGRRWGRGVAVLAQLLLLPVALAVSWRQPEYGVPVALVAVVALVLLFTPSASRWVTYADEAANPDSAPPESR